MQINSDARLIKKREKLIINGEEWPDGRLYDIKFMKSTPLAR